LCRGLGSQPLGTTVAIRRASNIAASESPDVPGTLDSLRQRWCFNVDNSLAVILTSDMIGLIARDVPVTLVNISRGGGLLESTFSVPVGTIAGLQMEIHGRVYADTIRVTRCALVPGAGDRHHLGVAFLQLDVPGPQSLRLYAARAMEPRRGAWRTKFEAN